MSREISVAAVQLPAFRHGETNAEKMDANFAAAEHWLDEAGRRGADIACVGETFNTLGLALTANDVPRLTADAVEQTTRRLGAVARQHSMYVIAPVMAMLDGTPRNVGLLLDREGKLIGAYCKVHCIENERALGLVPGNEWQTFNLDFGCVGVQICHDNSFPESARCLMLNGAEIIFWPHVMSGWGGEFMDVLLRAPAVHNGVHFVPVCYGCEPDRAWRPGMLIGRSSIIGPDAVIHADAGRYPDVALARIDLDTPRLATGFTRDGDYVWHVDMLNDRRPDTYSPLTRPHMPTDPIAAGASREDQEKLLP